MQPLDLPNNKFKKEKYTPDSNGYFVCEKNLIITNIALCEKYQGVSLKFNSNTNYTRYNCICENCKIDLKKVKTVGLEKYDKLSEQLQEYIKSNPFKNTNNVSDIEYSTIREIFRII